MRLYSDGLHELEAHFQSLTPPYTHQHIREFNSIYRRIYPILTRDEKTKAESFVDSLIEGVEQEVLITRIFGVV
jgi:hypothetical protein